MSDALDKVEYLAVQCEGGYPLCDDAIAAGAMLREQAAEITRLRALSAQPAAVPGWQLVPVTPTAAMVEAMARAWQQAVESDDPNECVAEWRAALAAAPQAPQQDNSRDERQG